MLGDCKLRCVEPRVTWLQSANKRSATAALSSNARFQHPKWTRNMEHHGTLYAYELFMYTRSLRSSSARATRPNSATTTTHLILRAPSESAMAAAFCIERSTKNESGESPSAPAPAFPASCGASPPRPNITALRSESRTPHAVARVSRALLLCDCDSCRVVSPHRTALVSVLLLEVEVEVDQISSSSRSFCG